jgi:hypothetical protein
MQQRQHEARGIEHATRDSMKQEIKRLHATKDKETEGNKR